MLLLITLIQREKSRIERWTADQLSGYNSNDPTKRTPVRALINRGLEGQKIRFISWK